MRIKNFRRTKCLLLSSMAVFLMLVPNGFADVLTMPLSWDATEAEADLEFSKFGGGHSLWNLLGNRDKWIFDGAPGLFEEGLIDGRHALLTGTIVEKGMESDPNATRYDVHVAFEQLENYDEFVPPGEPKMELYNEAYAQSFLNATSFTGESGGPGTSADIDPRTWRYYALTPGGFDGSNFSGSYMTKVGDNQGDYFLLTPRPSDFKFEGQVGEGASGKNLNNGFSSWWFADRFVGGNQVASNQKGDVNVDLTPIPEPGTYLLLGLGLSMMALRRRTRSK